MVSNPQNLDRRRFVKRCPTMQKRVMKRAARWLVYRYEATPWRYRSNRERLGKSTTAEATLFLRSLLGTR